MNKLFIAYHIKNNLFFVVRARIFKFFNCLNK